jgi:hypothetical protein
MWKKKTLLTVVAAAAVVLANPAFDKADAATFNPVVQEKVYVYQGTNMNEINSVLEKYLASFGFTVPKTTVKQPVQTEPSQPTQQPAQTTTSQPRTAATCRAAVRDINPTYYTSKYKYFKCV